jgi:hypothetical protein
MKSFSEFNTLTEAQAYEHVAYSKITAGQSSQYFGLSGMLDALESNSADPTPLQISATMTTTVGALCRTVLNSAKGTGFAADPATVDGANNRGAAQLLLVAGVFPSQPIVNGFWSISETKTKPYEFKTQAEFDEAKDAGETLALPSNNDFHTAKINITTQPSKPIDIVVEQRFSKDGTDWTEWHSVGAFRNVDYPQRNYEASVPKSPAAFRELRAVSPLTLGVEVA